jgi:hypothetical protein
MNETSWDTVKRIDRSDPILEELQGRLHDSLRPERYNLLRASIRQSAITAHLEARSRTERTNRAAMAVAGLYTPGFQEAA